MNTDKDNPQRGPQRALQEPTMALPVPTDPDITVAHLAELAEAAGRPGEQAHALRGARALKLRFANTPCGCQFCWLRHRHQPDLFEPPIGGARYSIEVPVDGHPHRFLTCTAHAGLRAVRTGARLALGLDPITGAKL